MPDPASTVTMTVSLHLITLIRFPYYRDGGEIWRLTIFLILQFNIEYKYGGQYISSDSGDPGKPGLSYYWGTRSPQPTEGEELVLGIPLLLALRSRHNYLVERDDQPELDFYPVNLDIYPVSGGGGGRRSQSLEAVT